MHIDDQNFNRKFLFENKQLQIINTFFPELTMKVTYKFFYLTSKVKLSILCDFMNYVNLNLKVFTNLHGFLSNLKDTYKCTCSYNCIANLMMIYYTFGNKDIIKCIYVLFD